MNYDEAANFLFDLRRFQVKPGTESVRDLLAHLGDPHEDVDFVQVAGSNGKGSTARMTESVLREAGLRVGLYTSPHLDDLRERVRVDGRKVTRSSVAAFVEAAKPYLVERAADGEPLTFFETVTALALWDFGHRDVDVAVLEVGLGGKYDATSVVDPVAAAVTNVSLEHTAILGDTVGEIAERKAAVAPADAPLVTAATGEALATIRAHVGDVVTVGTGDDADVRVAYGGRRGDTEADVEVAFDDRAVSALVPMLGRYQALNAGVAAALCRHVADVDAATLRLGLRAAEWPGRFEVLERDPLVVLDGAHNPEACAAVAETLSTFEYDDLHLVFGAMHDKDHRAMVEALPAATTVTTVEPNLDRAEDPEVLAAVFEATEASVTAGDDVADAATAARERSGAADVVLVVGSLFCVAEARTAWTRRVVPTAVDDTADAAALRARLDAPPGGDDELRTRTLRTRLSRDRAERVREELRAVGGTALLSGHDTDGELLDVALSGTVAELRALAAALDDAGDGLAGVGADVREALDGSRPTHGYPWETGTSVMGVLNVTPDSFHDGGEHFAREAAVERAEKMVAAGAEVVDVGGESTRPGADPVSVDTERDRVVPVVEAVATLDADVEISVDTRKPAVARAALDAGATVLNDVTGLADPEMRALAADRGVPTVVMHSIDAPVVPGKDVAYDDVVTDVIDELAERVRLAERAGLPREKVLVDPGLGFGKTKRENFELLSRLDEFHALGCPVLVGHSHKSMFELVGEPAGDSFEATVAATALAAAGGADVVRVHDVAANVAAVRVAAATADPTGFVPRNGE
jgi:dihydropteroate synthase